MYPALCCVCMPTRRARGAPSSVCRFRADAGKRRLKQSTLSSLAEPAPDLPHGRPAWCSFWIHECGQSSELTQPFCILRTRHQDPIPGASAIKFQRPGCWTGCTDHHPATKCCGQPERAAKVSSQALRSRTGRPGSSQRDWHAPIHHAGQPACVCVESLRSDHVPKSVERIAEVRSAQAVRPATGKRFTPHSFPLQHDDRNLQDQRTQGIAHIWAGVTNLPGSSCTCAPARSCHLHQISRWPIVGRRAPLTSAKLFCCACRAPRLLFACCQPSPNSPCLMPCARNHHACRLGEGTVWIW